MISVPEFVLRKFKPRDDIIKKMTDRARDNAVNEANDLFP